MHIAKGDDRVVLVLPRVGIVLKLPNVYTSSSHVTYYCEMVWLHRSHFWRHPRSFWCHVGYVFEALGDYLCMTVRGIVANWRERVFYKSVDSTVRKLLAPTYVSLLGFINVQRFHTPAQGLGFTIQYALQHACDDMRANAFARYDDSHHFSYSGNFHIPDDCTVVFLDYANEKVQKLLMEYGEKIVNNFHLSYGRERDAYWKSIIAERDAQ